jgi:hypothetical protein
MRKQIDGQSDRQMVRETDGQSDRWADRQIRSQTDKWAYRYADKETNTDGKIDWQTSECTNKLKNKFIDIQTHYYPNTQTQTHRHTHSHTYTNPHPPIHTHTHTHTHTYTYSETGWQIHRQTDGQYSQSLCDRWCIFTSRCWGPSGWEQSRCRTRSGGSTTSCSSPYPSSMSTKTVSPPSF